MTVPTPLALQTLASMLDGCRALRMDELGIPVVFTRLNEHCRPAERLAQLVFRNESLHASALVFEHAPGNVAYVADTKYKVYADGYGRDTDYYQILAHTAALNVPEAKLIYCQRDGGAPPREVSIGSLHKSLITWSLSLGGTPSDVESQLLRLAEEIALRACAVPETHP